MQQPYDNVSNHPTINQPINLLQLTYQSNSSNRDDNTLQ